LPRVIVLLVAYLLGVGSALAGDALGLYVSDRADEGSYGTARALIAGLLSVPGVDDARLEGALRSRVGAGGSLYEIAGISDTLIIRSASDHFRSARDEGADLWRQSRPIAVLTADVSALAVRSESAVRDFPMLLAWIGEHPRRFTVAGASPLLGLDHLLLGLILREASLDLGAARYLPGRDTQSALARLDAGETSVVIAPLESLLTAERAGRVRVLVTTAPRGREGAGGKPSLADLGHNVVFEDWRAVMMPPRVPAASAGRLREIVMEAASGPAWREALESGSLTERRLTEVELTALIEEQERLLEAVRRQMPTR